MVHRCECLLFTSQLWLPYSTFCFDPSECFWDLCIWSGAMGNKSSKLQYVSQIVTHAHSDVYMHNHTQLYHTYNWINAGSMSDPCGPGSHARERQLYTSYVFVYCPLLPMPGNCLFLV